MDERLRSHLSAVDTAELASADEIGAGVVRSQRRHERTRRTMMGAAVVVLLAAGGMVVWNSGGGPERVTSGDGSAPTTIPAADPATTILADTTTSADPEGSAWDVIPPGPSLGLGATVVWTGTEAVAFGGLLIGTQEVMDHGVDAFNPVTEQWRHIAETVPLLAPIVVWTGDSILAVGWSTVGGPRSVAASLSLDTGEWTILADAPEPDKLWSSDPWVWTGTELLIMSGNQALETATVQAFNPSTNEWRTLTAAPLAPRYNAASVWTGDEWLIWGGSYDTKDYADGVAYNPKTDTYRPLAESPLSARRVPGTWTGSEMVFLGGASGGDSSGNGEMAYSDGAAYDPATDTWHLTKPGFAHPGFVPVWTGSLIIQFAKGGAVWYDPAKDEWSSGDMTFGEVSHDDRSPVWTGSQVLLLGSYDGKTGGATFTPPP
jgi:hypothetical protein